MKEKKHFGILPKNLYLKNNIDEIIQYFVSNKICKQFISRGIIGKLEKTDKLGEFRTRGQLSEEKNITIYSKNISNEFYEFLLDHYNAGLGSHILFDFEFDQNTFGLDFNDSRKIALDYFNTHYNQLAIIDSFKYSFDENRNIVPATRFEALERHKKSLLSNLERKLELIIPYLAGDDSYYNRELFETNATIKEIFDFENILQILVNLNKKYQFEKDDDKSSKSIAMKIFENYGDEFDSLKQIEFIEFYIESKEKVVRADILALFDFFLNELKIKKPSGKKFGDIINNYFQQNFGEIKLNGSAGDTHKIRLNKLYNAWEKFNC